VPVHREIAPGGAAAGDGAEAQRGSIDAQLVTIEPMQYVNIVIIESVARRHLQQRRFNSILTYYIGQQVEVREKVLLSSLRSTQSTPRRVAHWLSAEFGSFQDLGGGRFGRQGRLHPGHRCLHLAHDVAQLRRSNRNSTSVHRQRKSDSTSMPSSERYLAARPTTAAQYAIGIHDPQAAIQFAADASSKSASGPSQPMPQLSFSTADAQGPLS
jgi:hypothetical protein